MTTLREELCRRDNDYTPPVGEFEARTGREWSRPAPASLNGGRPLSVVIPAHNSAYCIMSVLDALHASVAARPFEIVVVDDGSSDLTGILAAGHPARPSVVRLPVRMGAPVARNAGTAVASGETVLYLDADMVVPSHVVHDFVVRGGEELVVLGFRHNVAYAADADPTRASLPPEEPDLEQDHRVRWRAGPGRLLYSGIELVERVEGRPLDETDDLKALGRCGRYHDWDLPRMVVTAMVAVPRRAVIAAGGFEPAFSAGWGVEDTHLGAKLIALGLKVVPLRPAVGFHIDPPDAADSWRRKLALWPRNLDLYRRLLEEPAPRDGTAWFERHVRELLGGAQVRA